MTRRSLLRGVTVLACATVALSACSSDGIVDGRPADLDPTPYGVDAPAPTAAATNLALPEEFENAPLLDPGWIATPQEAGGIFLGLREETDRVVFSAVSDTGSVLWEAERPMICSASVATMAADRPIGVLMDLRAGTDTFVVSTATGYDLRTGEEIWGPVKVPGPHQGPGLVFAAPPEQFMGSSGPRVALDPSAGTILADERELPGARIVGEQGGIVLIADQDELTATSDGEQVLWSLPLEEVGWATAGASVMEDIQLSDDAAMLGDAASGYTLIRLGDGAILARDVQDATVDDSTGTLIALGDHLTGYDDTGALAWEHDSPADSTLVSAGRGALYLRTPDGIHVYDSATGTARATALRVDVPDRITSRGAALIGPTGRPLLVVVSDR
ncbi:hypothetical protein ACI3KS_04260 [Microbacterium sp. ZW T5_45]|uniref:hypothetical protein n=1 Tax=Microbacterium sp. ZW T5_45 TaxID=3378080 RepID=UPI003851952A